MFFLIFIYFTFTFNSKLYRILKLSTFIFSQLAASRQDAISKKTIRYKMKDNLFSSFQNVCIYVCKVQRTNIVAKKDKKCLCGFCRHCKYFGHCSGAMSVCAFITAYLSLWREKKKAETKQQQYTHCNWNVAALCPCIAPPAVWWCFIFPHILYISFVYYFSSAETFYCCLVEFIFNFMIIIAPNLYFICSLFFIWQPVCC